MVSSEGSDAVIRFRIAVESSDDATAEDAERALHGLRRDLVDSGALSVEAVAGSDVPAGAKGTEMMLELVVAVTAGTLHVVLPMALEPFSKHWRGRGTVTGPTGNTEDLRSLSPERLKALASVWSKSTDDAAPGS